MSERLHRERLQLTRREFDQNRLQSSCLQNSPSPCIAPRSRSCGLLLRPGVLAWFAAVVYKSPHHLSSEERVNWNNDGSLSAFTHCVRLVFISLSPSILYVCVCVIHLLFSTLALRASSIAHCSSLIIFACSVGSAAFSCQYLQLSNQQTEAYSEILFMLCFVGLTDDRCHFYIDVCNN